MNRRIFTTDFLQGSSFGTQIRTDYFFYYFQSVLICVICGGIIYNINLWMPSCKF